MALVSKRNYKTVLGDTTLELEANTGESFLIKDVKIYNPATDYATFNIETNTVGYFRVGGVLGSHLPFPAGRSQHSHDMLTGATEVAVMANGALIADAGGIEMAAPRLAETAASTLYSRVLQLAKAGLIGGKTIIRLLIELGYFNGYPIAQGETFSIAGVAQADAIQMVEYEVYDPGDQMPEMPNGSKGTEKLYINYGGSGAVINLTGNTLLNKTANPAEFPDFPFGKNVPGNRQIDLIGLLASDVAPSANEGTNYTYSKYLSFFHDTQFLFDEDKNGLLYYNPIATALGTMDHVGEGYSVGGNLSDIDARFPHIFDPAIVFDDGEELVIQWNTERTLTGQSISEALQEIGLILKLRPKT